MSEQRVIMCAGELIDQLRKETNGRTAESVFILVDSNTRRLCLPALSGDEYFGKVKFVEIAPNDDNKTLEALASVWTFLSENKATRKSLLINLGGGMVTDLGGFAASTFKRGMDYVNIPTTLLGAVDAAVGGKTGINFCGYKNEIGVINSSQSVLIDVNFFRTLTRKDLLSGYAEMIKHGLISDEKHWNDMLKFDLENIDYLQLQTLLRDSIAVKEKIVEIDPTEKNIRKALNFGHTVGHAFESHAMEVGDAILHGYAVAYGMISELYLSHKICNFPKELMRQAVALIKENYGALPISCKVYDHLYDLMTHDKKNVGDGRILFTLLGDKGIGDIRINQDVDKKTILESIDYYRDVVGL